MLLERERELEVALQALTEAASGEGRVLLVEGPAGIGKTRLLEAVAGMALDAGFEVHAARGDELETAFAFGVVRQILAPVLARLDPADRAVVLEGSASLIASIVEGTSGPLSDGVGSEGLAAAYGLYQLVQDLAERRPRLFLVDDAHWADLSSLHALAFVARRLSDLPVLMLLTSRRSVDGPAKDVLALFSSVERSRCLTPRTLTEKAVATLARSTFDPDLDTAVCQRLWRLTAGNPFLVRELVAGLRAGEQSLAHLGTSDYERLVPERVGQSVMRRLTDVGDQAVRLADAVAVLGEAPLQEAAQLAGLGELEAVTAADRLVAADILAAGSHLRFAHPILRQAVRAHIPPARRSLEHARAARLLSDRGAPLERVAAQLLEALPRSDPWVVESLGAAAVQERQRGSPETAVSLLARALTEPPAPELQPQIALALARAQAESGHSDAVATAHHALAIAKDPFDEAEARLHLARTLALAGDFWSAVDLLGEQPSAQTALDPEVALQLETELLGSARLGARTREEALARLDQLAPQAIPPRPTSVVLLANLALSALERNEPPEKVAELAQLALVEDWLIESGSFQFAYAGEALMFIDRLEEAKRACDAVLEVAQRRGSAMLSTVVHGLRSEVHLRSGAVADAEADARIAYRLNGELVARGLPAPGMPFTRAHLASALMMRGEWDEAGLVLADAEPAERAEDNPFYLECRGEFRMTQGDSAAALEDFLDCGRSLAGRGGADSPSVLPWRSDAAFTLLQLGDGPRAYEFAVGELNLATKQQVAGAIAQALIAVGLVEGGEEGIARLRDAVSILEGSPRVLIRVRALTELGSMLRRNRQPQAARSFLVEALDLAHRHGATALADRAREELVVAGGRPRRPVTTGLDALTPSERRVAQLAAQGLTNRQIADRLFVSARTVTTHLTHIYQKLGPVSRDELGATFSDSNYKP